VVIFLLDCYICGAFQYSAEQDKNNTLAKPSIEGSKTIKDSLPQHTDNFLEKSKIKGKSILEAKQEYKGFLLIKCGHCGKIKGFCIKTSISEFICDCGGKTELKDLKAVFLNCKCGRNYKYYTNVTDETFETKCLNCGSPIDLKFNNRRNNYVTIADRMD